jgi:hypothetical protein
MSIQFSTYMNEYIPLFIHRLSNRRREKRRRGEDLKGARSVG